MILKAAGTPTQRHASPCPSRYAPSADSYATPINFEEPHYAPQKKPGISISASQQRGFVAYVRHDWAFPYSAQALRVQGILTT